MTAYTIRPVNEGDVPFLWDMLYESLHVREGQEPFGREVILEPSLAKYVDGWGQAGDLGYVAVSSEGRPIGSITVRFFNDQNPGYGFIRHDIPELGMAILPEYRGKGIGTALLSRLFEALTQAGIKRVSLSVDPANMAAVKLYERFGFVEAGTVGSSITMVADVNRPESKETDT